MVSRMLPVFRREIITHLIYNCETGHLPPLEDVEYELRFLSDYKGGDLQYIMEMKERGIF